MDGILEKQAVKRVLAALAENQIKGEVKYFQKLQRVQLRPLTDWVLRLDKLPRQLFLSSLIILHYW